MSDLIHNFGIEWKILIAQIVNFAILLFVLKKFAFKPVMKILEERRARIEKAIHQAQSVEDKMREIDVMKEAVLAEARKESSEIIAKTEAAAIKVQESLIAEGNKKAEKILADAAARMKLEGEKLRDEIKNEISGLIADATERTVGDLFDANTQRKMVSQAAELIKRK